MAETRRDCVTLAALLAVLQEQDRVFIVHRMGPHECEDVVEIGRASCRARVF